MRKNVLIIERDFIPYSNSFGYCIRMVKLAEFLLQNGIDVFVLAAKGRLISYFGYEKLLKRLNVFYVPDFFQRWRVSSIITQKENNGDKKSWKVNIFLWVLKKLIKPTIELLQELSIPDIYVFGYRRYYKKASQIIDNKKIRNVIISSPTHSMQLVGLLLKKRYGKRINLIVDYRDSLNKIPIIRTICNRFEEKVLKNADYFTCVTPPILDKINKNFFDISKKSVVVMNGYDENIKIPREWRNRSEDNTLTIGHFGTIYTYRSPKFRNPEPFFKMLLDFRKKIKVFFYGKVVIDKKWQDRLRGVLEIGGNLPHKDALKMMQKMDLLLVFSTRGSADEAIPGKLFEYIFSEKPILLVGPKDMYCTQIFDFHRLGYVMDLYSKQDMLDKMNQIYNDWKAGRLKARYKKEDFSEYSRQNQYRKMLDILK